MADVKEIQLVEKDPKIDEKIQYVVNMLSKQVDVKNLTKDKLTILILQGMSIMTNFNTMSGTNKKIVLLDAVKYIIRKNISDENAMALLILFMDQFGSGIIDGMFYVSKESIKFVKTGKCFGCCSGNPV